MDSVRLAIFAATLATIGRLARVAYLRHVKETFAWASRDVVWMAALANAAIFLAVLGGLSLGARIARRRLGPDASHATLGALAAFSLLLNLPALHPAADLMAALGVGSWYARRMRTASPALQRRLGRAGVGAFALLLLVGGGEALARGWRARRAAAASRGAGPSVLVLLLDTVRARSLGLYGHPGPTTPRLEAVAREAVTFDLAFSPSSWTLPSHAAMLTGVAPDALGVGWRTPLTRPVPTLAERFSDAGYATAAFAANPYYVTHESGLARGFGHFEDHGRSWREIALASNLLHPVVVHRLLGARSLAAVRSALRAIAAPIPAEPPHKRRDAAAVIGAFLAWKRTPRPGPYFALLNLFDAHGPLSPPAAYRARFARGASPPDSLLYLGGIAYLDAQVGALLDTLRVQGELDRTIVVVTSDHGEQFGERFGERPLDGHGNSLYLPAVHVPLLVRHPPRTPAGRRIGTPVSLQDLPATLLDLADIPGVLGTSRSLARTWEGVTPAVPDVIRLWVNRNDDSAKDWAPTRLGALHAVASGSWYLVRDARGRIAMYDLRDALGTPPDVAGDPAVAAIATRLQAALGPTPR